MAIRATEGVGPNFKRGGIAMRRTKEWWSNKSPEQRHIIVSYERLKNVHYGYGGGGYLPDDTTECGVCGQPCLSSPCEYCCRIYNQAIA